MTKKIIYTIISMVIIIAVLTGCHQGKEANTTLPSEKSTTAVTTTESASEVTTAETTTKVAKPSTMNETTENKTTESSTEKASTTKAYSTTTTTKKHTTTTTTKRVTTTQKPSTTKKVTTTTTTTTEKAFDINYWVSYAKNYAKSVGLKLNSSATDCWDNPINANPNCQYLERDIKDRLGRYAKDDDITEVWVWTEKTGTNSYKIYIGYA